MTLGHYKVPESFVTVEMTSIPPAKPSLAILLLALIVSQTCAQIADKDLLGHFLKNYKQPAPVPSASGVDSDAVPSGQPDRKTVSPSGNVIAPSADHSDVDCECVKYYQCRTEGPDPDDLIGAIIDLRSSTCSSYLEICCKQLQKLSDDPQKPDPQPPVAAVSENVCGKRNEGGVGFRITGATDGESQFGEFPWMAAITQLTAEDANGHRSDLFICGGSLIHPQVVLTAAHCVHSKPMSDLKVRLGEWDTQTKDEIYVHQDRFVTRIVIHEDFKPRSTQNGIALLILDTPVTFSPNIGIVCLPAADDNFDGQRCVASGWGKDSYGKEGKYQAILKKLELPVVAREDCQEALRRTRLGPYFKLDSSFVCAGGEPGKDTCRGDGGSPLVCPIPDSSQYVQYGIVAWGIGCGDGGTPGVYVNVPKFVPWIDQKMVEAGFETKYYKEY